MTQSKLFIPLNFPVCRHKDLSYFNLQAREKEKESLPCCLHPWTGIFCFDFSTPESDLKTRHKASPGLEEELKFIIKLPQCKKLLHFNSAVIPTIVYSYVQTSGNGRSQRT